MYAQLSIAQSYRQWRLWPLFFFVAPRDVVPANASVGKALSHGYRTRLNLERSKKVKF